MTSTYSPTDNKLRLYPSTRLPEDVYRRVKAAGFIWAPKQELFVAPMWTPNREDLLLELCGEIGDEDTSLVERAEVRAERFEDYSEKRANDAAHAHAAVKAIADGIPLGQPILVGHHSERHARKDAERIENGMRKAVAMWDTSEYWKSRARGAVAAAKYKERPDVRARRIKKLEAEKRKAEKEKGDAEFCLRFWNGQLKRKEEAGGGFLEVTRKTALWFCNSYDHIYTSFLLVEYPRPLPASQYEGPLSLWSALGGSDGPEHMVCTLDQAREIALRMHGRAIENRNRWIAHYENRLEYERTMLAEDGGTVTDRKGPEKGGACKCWAGPNGGWAYIQKVNKVSVTILDNWGNGGGNFTRTIPFDKLKAIISAAEVQSARESGNLKETNDKTGFFLVSDFHKEEPRKEPAYTTPPAEIMAMKETLQAGVQVVSTPQLFPTPRKLAEQLVNLAELKDGHRILEPSAGTGAILNAITTHCDVVAVEINVTLADRLRLSQHTKADIRCADFLQCNGDLGQFDRILMNPPFDRGADIQHIKHALTFLKPEGRLVAICANGPKQREILLPLADEWIDLEPGAFKESGTDVNAAMLVINH